MIPCLQSEFPVSMQHCCSIGCMDENNTCIEALRTCMHAAMVALPSSLSRKRGLHNFSICGIQSATADQMAPSSASLCTHVCTCKLLSGPQAIKETTYSISAHTCTIQRLQSALLSTSTKLYTGAREHSNAALAII